MAKLRSTNQNETNNTLAIGGYIINESDVDFTFIDVSLSTDIIENGSSFDITFHAKNQGPTNVDGTVSVGFYLSTDNVISIDDLGIVWNNESWMGSDHSVILTTAIPWAQPGNYYIIGFVEDGGPCCGYDETDKDNNYWYLPFVITPADIDLEIVSPLMVTVSDSQ